MLTTVFKLEWRNLWRDGAARIVVGLFALLVAYAAATSARRVTAEHLATDTALLVEEQRDDQLVQELHAIAAGQQVQHASDPRKALLVGRELAPRVAAMPPGPLAVVAVGQRDVLPASVELTTQTRRDGPGGDDGANPLKQSNGPFDLAFVFAFLLPLVVIALSYDLLSAERERGTLALVLSQPIRLTTFVLGKATQRAALLSLLVAVVGVLAPVAAGADIAADGAPLRLLLYLLLIVVYAMFWLALAVLVNSWKRSSAANALTLIGCWLALLVVVPGLASVAVDTIYPSPSRVELVKLTRDAASDAEARTSAAEGDHGKPADAISANEALAMQAQLEEQLEPVRARFREQRRQRQALVDDLRFLSPAILVNEGLSDVAGSSVSRHEHFAVQVDSYHVHVKRFFGERVERGAPLTSADYAALPRFEYRNPPDAQLTRRVGTSLLALVLAIAALLAAAAARFKNAELGRG